jgi:hypothetical protein
MAVDIYTKNISDDQDYSPSIADINDDLLMYINQIRNIFSAEPGTILGASSMGIGLETKIYEISMSAKNLEKDIIEQIHRYATLNYKFKTNIRVKFARGTIRDIVFIDIIIDDKKQMELRIS